MTELERLKSENENLRSILHDLTSGFSTFMHGMTDLLGRRPELPPLLQEHEIECFAEHPGEWCGAEMAAKVLAVTPEAFNENFAPLFPPYAVHVDGDDCRWFYIKMVPRVFLHAQEGQPHDY